MKKIVIGSLITLALLITFGKSLWGYNESTDILVKQAFPSGELSCIAEPGIYWKGWAKIDIYSRGNSFYFNSSNEKVNGKGWEGEEDDEDDFNVTLQRNSVADVSGFLKYKIPTNCNKLIELHRDFKSNKSVKHDLIRNATYAAVNKSAPLFTAEEAKVTKIAEFRRMAEDQLIIGEFLAHTLDVYDTIEAPEFDDKGNMVKDARTQKYTITKLKLDSNGNRITIKESALAKYGITVLQFEIKNVKPDAKTQQQLDIVKEREMQRITNATESETAKQKAITEFEKGQARIAEAKANEEVQKIKEVTQAEKEKAVAVLTAQKEFEVSQLEAQAASENAKKILSEGRANAEANRLKVNAGLDPKTKLEIEAERDVKIAEALAKSENRLTPDFIIGGDGKNGSAIEVIATKMFMDMHKEMQAQKK